MNKLLMAADANGLARRMWHIGETSLDETREMFAVYEFFSYLIRLDGAYSPAKVFLAWDSPPYFRSKMYPPYKANRPGVDGNWTTQLYWMKRIADVAGIAQAEWPSYEADDVLATIAKRHENCLVVTGDKDLLSLVSASTTVELLRWTEKEGTHRKRFASRLDVKEFMGVFPEQVSTYKALAGDQSDNIPGVTGVGHKTAVALLEQYQTFQGIYDHIHYIVKADGKPFVYAKNLVWQHEDAVLYKTLCTPVVIKDLALPGARPLNIKAISDGLKEMESENSSERS